MRVLFSFLRKVKIIIVNQILSKKASNVNELTKRNENDGHAMVSAKRAKQKMSQSEEEKNWWAYFAIHKHDNKLVGSGGYKGKPITEGTLELGYQIAANYRNRGLVTEITKGLIENAFNDSRIKSIIAHTPEEENASTKVLLKCSFKKVQEIIDTEYGQIWKWELKGEQ